MTSSAIPKTASGTQQASADKRLPVDAFQSLWILLALAVLMGVFGALAPSEFLSAFNLRSLATDAAVLLVLSLGQTFVIVTAGIDLSVGAVLVFSSVVAAKVMAGQGGASGGTAVVLLGLAVSLSAGVAWGLFNGFLVARAKVPPLIVTLGTFGMALGLSNAMTSGTDIRDVPLGLSSTIGFGDVLGIPVLVLIAVAVSLLGGLLLHTTRFGLRTFATGSNPEAARRVGVPVNRQLAFVYVIAGLCAGLAGWLSLARFGSTTLGGHTTDNLATITAVVLGGTSLFGGRGSVVGTVIGVFIPVVLANGLVIQNVQPFWQDVVIGAVLIGAVYLDQLRRRSREQN